MFFLLDTKISDKDSFGIVGLNVARALKALNHSVLTIRWPESDPNIKSPGDTAAHTVDCFIRVCHPDGPFSPPNICKNSGVLCMFETTELYKRTVLSDLNGVNFFATPSTWCTNILKELVNVPVYVWNHGVDCIRDIRASRLPAGKCRVVMAGHQESRKFSDGTVKIFNDYFFNDPLIELVVKCQKGYKPGISYNTNNITFIEDDLTREELEDLYLTANVVIMPSRGEGFGLTALEAAALGVPILVTGYGGHMDYVPDCAAITIDYKIVDVPENYLWKGQWAEPSVEDFMHKLELFRDGEIKLGQEAIDKAPLVRAKWSWKATTARFLKELNG